MEQITYPSGLIAVQHALKKDTQEAQLANKQVTYLSEALGIPTTYIETSKEPENTRQDVLDAVTEGDVVIVIGGDGTVKEVGSALLSYERRLDAPHEGLLTSSAADAEHMRRLGKPVLLSAIGGTAGDFRNNLHRGDMFAEDALLKLVEKGIPLEIPAICLSILTSEGLREEVAFQNLGLHQTAILAEMLNSPKHREGWIRKYLGTTAQEAWTGLRSMKNLTTFNSYEAGQEQDLSSMWFIHAQIVGKWGRFNVTHVDPEFLDVRQRHARKLNLNLAAARMVLGIAGGRRRDFAHMVIGPDGVSGQADGEVFPIPADALLSFYLSNETVRTLGQKAA